VRGGGVRDDDGAGRDCRPHRRRPRPAPVRLRQGRPATVARRETGLFGGCMRAPIASCRSCNGRRTMSACVLTRRWWPSFAALSKDLPQEGGCGRASCCGGTGGRARSKRSHHWRRCACLPAHSATSAAAQRACGLGQLLRRPHPRPPQSRRATVAPARTPVRGARGHAYMRARSDLGCHSVAPLCPSFDVPAGSGARRAGARCRRGAGHNAQGQGDTCLFALRGVHSQAVRSRCPVGSRRQGINNGGAAAVARALSSNRTVERVCVQHRVPAWGKPMWHARSSLTSLAPAARPRLSSL